jgi:propionate CoA-transferase
VKLITAAEAANLVKSGDTIIMSGSGQGHVVAESVLVQIEERFHATGLPRDVTLMHVGGTGDRAKKGPAHFAHEGLLKRSITSAPIDAPPLFQLILDNKIESYVLPMGVLSQMMREIAGGRPGVITKTGLHTFVDPRQLGGRQSAKTQGDVVEVIQLSGEEWLHYKPFKIDVAILRGTTADEDGNVTMEQEAVLGEMLSTAQAVRRTGGVVIVQVKRLAQRNTLPPRQVKIPGILVDYIVHDPEQWQSYATRYEPSFAGELRIPLDNMKPLSFSIRKIIARRAALELYPRAICNLGAGISTGISFLAAEENALDTVVLTNEQGFIGGAPQTGLEGGTAQNYSANVDQTYQFDFYDGGGLDLAFLSFPMVDPSGNVNVSRFGNKLVGVGGFINISQYAKKVVFSGTFTAGELEIESGDGKLRIVKEGKHKKFVNEVEQICYNGKYAESQGRRVMFVTERAVFEFSKGELELVEIAPGIDLERDVLAHMRFKPRLSPTMKLMDERIFRPEPMGLRKDILDKAV